MVGFIPICDTRLTGLMNKRQPFPQCPQEQNSPRKHQFIFLFNPGTTGHLSLCIDRSISPRTGCRASDTQDGSHNWYPDPRENQCISVGLWKTDCGLRTADCGLRTADCGLRTADCGLRTADCGLRTADCGLRTADCGLRTTD